MIILLALSLLFLGVFIFYLGLCFWGLIQHVEKNMKGPVHHGLKYQEESILMEPNSRYLYNLY